MKARYSDRMRVLWLSVAFVAGSFAFANPVEDLHRAGKELSKADAGSHRTWRRFCRALTSELVHERGDLRHRVHAAIARAFPADDDRVSIRTDPGIVRVIGGKGAMVFRVESRRRRHLGPTENVIVSPSAAGCICRLLETDDFDLSGELEANAATITGGVLLVGGTLDDLSNSPRGGVEAFRLVEGRWKGVGSAETERESWRGALPTADKRGLVVITRSDPKHLSPCHAGPRSTWADEYRMQRGRLAHTASRRRSTGVNALDDLVGDVGRADWAGVRRLCATAALAHHVIGYAGRLSGDDLSLRSNASLGSDDDKAMYLSDAGLWFRFERHNGRMVLVKLRERRRAR